MDQGIPPHSKDSNSELGGEITQSRAVSDSNTVPNGTTSALKEISCLSAEVNLIDLNTPENCDTDKTVIDGRINTENGQTEGNAAVESTLAHNAEMKQSTVSHQSDMLTSRTESGYLTDSIYSSTLSRDRHESVGSESDKTPCRDSLSSPNGLGMIRDSESSDEKTLDELENFGVPNCSTSNFEKKSLDIADLDEIFSVNGAASRPESLSLPKPLQHYERPHSKSDASKYLLNGERPRDRKRSKSSGFPIPRVKEGVDLSEEGLSKSLPHGLIMKKGELIEFIADDLQEKIRRSSPLSKTESSGMSSRTSSLRSINSMSSSASSTMATSFTSGMSRSPSSAFQQSPDTIPPIDPSAIEDLEIRSRQAADSLDLMMGNLRNNLHKMSAITVGCEEAYKTSVDVTCDSVDGSIKSMYALMAKCEELSASMVPIYKLADQIKEIKRLLDRFEGQLLEKT